jgi:hypothetical protein
MILQRVEKLSQNRIMIKPDDDQAIEGCVLRRALMFRQRPTTHTRVAMRQFDVGETLVTTPCAKNVAAQATFWEHRV